MISEAKQQRAVARPPRPGECEVTEEQLAMLAQGQRVVAFVGREGGRGSADSVRIVLVPRGASVLTGQSTCRIK